MTMYERIKALRQLKGMSQQELARLTGYHDRSSIAKIEGGSVDLPQSKIILFAQVLGVTPADLMGLEDEAEAPNDLKLSPHEKSVILAYRAHPELQAAVDRVLLLPEETIPRPKQA